VTIVTIASNVILLFIAKLLFRFITRMTNHWIEYTSMYSMQLLVTCGNCFHSSSLLPVNLAHGPTRFLAHFSPFPSIPPIPVMERRRDMPLDVWGLAELTPAGVMGRLATPPGLRGRWFIAIGVRGREGATTMWGLLGGGGLRGAAVLSAPFGDEDREGGLVADILRNTLPLFNLARCP